jgi:hypothetical protein
LLAFWIYIFLQSNDPITYADPTYALRNLPPLSTKGQYGIFQSPDDDGIDVSMFVYTKLLLYSPNNHEGVNELMDQLAIAYPQVEIRGKKTSSDVETEYQANLFTTWGALEFELNDDQLTTGQLITSTTSASSVSYKLRICPSVMVCLPHSPSLPLFHSLFLLSASSSGDRLSLTQLVMKMFIVMLSPQLMLGSTLVTSLFRISSPHTLPRNTQEFQATSP